MAATMNTSSTAVSPDFIKCYNREVNSSLSGLALHEVTVQRVSDWAPFLECLLGPQHPPTAIVASITVTYGILFLTGVFGNACTIIVITKNKFMHTATNFYLFNLALADLLSLLIAMPLELYGYMWHQYPWELGSVMCRLRAVLAEAPAYASILTIVAFTIERFLAICHPLNLKSENREKLIRAAWVIFFLWIVSIGASAPMAFFHVINYIKDYDGNAIEESAWCNLAYDRPSRTWPTLFLTLTMMFFVIPLTVLAVLYGIIGCVLYKSCRPLPHQKHPPETRSHQNRGKRHQSTYWPVTTHNDQEPDPAVVNNSTVGISSNGHGVKNHPRGEQHQEKLLGGGDENGDQEEDHRRLQESRFREEMEAQRTKRYNLRCIHGVPIDEKSRKQYEMQRVRMLRRRAVIKMLGAVVVAFFICWAPFHAQRLLFVYVSISSEWTEQLRIANEVVSYLSGVLYFFNATLNPILYNLMSKRFRTAFKSTIFQVASCRSCVFRWVWYFFACIYDIGTCACIRDIFGGFARANSYSDDDDNDEGEAGGEHHGAPQAVQHLPGRQNTNCRQANKKNEHSGQHEMKVVDCWQQCSSSARSPRSRGSSAPPRGSQQSSSSGGSGKKRQMKKNKQLKRKLLSATSSSQVPAAKNCRTDGSCLPASTAASGGHIGLGSLRGIMEKNAPNPNGAKRNSASSPHSSKTVLQRAFPTVCTAKHAHEAEKKSNFPHRSAERFLSVGAPCSSDGSGGRGIFGHTRSHDRRGGSWNDRYRPAKSEGDDPDLIVDWSLLDPQRRLLTVPRQDLHNQGNLMLRHSASNATLHANPGHAGNFYNPRRGPVLLEASGGRKIYKFPARQQTNNAQSILVVDSCSSDCSNASVGNLPNRSGGSCKAAGCPPRGNNRIDVDMIHSCHAASQDAQLNQKSQARGSPSFVMGNLFSG